jgi:hypothetical protein
LKILAKHWKILDKLVEFTLGKKNPHIFFVSKLVGEKNKIKYFFKKIPVPNPIANCRWLKFIECLPTDDDDASLVWCQDLDGGVLFCLCTSG